MKQSNPENSLKAQFVIFRCQKYVKKGYMEMGEQLYLEPLKSVPGRSVFHYCQHYRVGPWANFSGKQNSMSETMKQPSCMKN